MIMTQKVSLYDHLVDRHIDFNTHKVWVDIKEDIATFPITNLTGQLLGYQQYRRSAGKEKSNSPKEGRYFTYTKKESRGVWGLESWDFSNTLFLTEGIFDAARLTELGYSAISVLSNDPKFLSSWLYIIKANRPIVSICDAGSAGRKLAKFGHTYHIMPDEYDLGDAPNDYVRQLIDDLS